MLDFVRSSKWMYLAATLMFAGATFQIADGRWLLATICFAAAASFVALGNKYRKHQSHSWILSSDL